LKICANKLRKPKIPSSDADEYRCSTTVVIVWFLYLLEFFPMPNLSAIGAMLTVDSQFGCQVIFGHDIPQVQTNLT
jgi:hypothetical protein